MRVPVQLNEVESDAAGPRQADEDQADRLVRGRAARARQPGGADGQIGVESLPAADRHRLGNRGADRAVNVEQILRHAQKLGLDAVVVGDDAAAEPDARAGNLRRADGRPGRP